MLVMAQVLSGVVVGLHVLFAYMETRGWSQMARRFGMNAEQTEATRALALNQGFYNLGLALVLCWALVDGHTETVMAMLIYVIAMAVVGAVSVSKVILLIQGVPAVLALVLWLLA